ncbi:hypothetical protein Trydic_g8469 [Trypoxylus dichotomus]
MIVQLAIIFIFIVTYCDGFNYNVKSMKDETDVLGRCRYRDHTTLYPADEIWRYVTGYSCYNYTNPSRLNHVLPGRITSLRNYTIHYVVLNGTNIAFDFESQYYLDLIRLLFRNDRYFNFWLDCSKSAVECCDEYLNSTNIFPTETHACPALWDGWDCWPPARAGETLRRVCPKYSAEDFVCRLESEKYCLENDWDHHTNYEICLSAPIYRRRHQFHVLVLIVSSALTTPAVLIFFTLMRNHKDLRHSLYRNLLISILLKNILTIISKEVIILDYLRDTNSSAKVMVTNSVWCRILSFFNSLTTVSVFTCMFVIAYYLHSTIARVFGKHLSLFMAYVITTACTLVPSLAWAIAMGIGEMENCWVIDTIGFHWITDVYKFAVLIANLILLLDIVRVICFQRSSSKLNPKQTKAAAKAILVLIPLFGIPILLTSQSGLINQESCLSGDIYYYTAYSVEALQGILVALLFCYLNKEVHGEFQNKYRKLIIRLNNRFNMDLKVPSQARATTMTNVRSSGFNH